MARPPTTDKSQANKRVVATDTAGESNTKKGSGSLLASSESDSWIPQRSRLEYKQNLSPHDFQASVNAEQLPHGIPPAISPTTNRPPTVNLTNPAFPYARKPFTPPHLNTSYGGEPPIVYPKNKDRSYPGTFTPADSVIDYTSATTSPVNERRPQWPTHYSNPTSVAASRDQSRAPYSQHADRQYSFQADKAVTLTRFDSYAPTPSGQNGSLSPSNGIGEFMSSFDSLNLGQAERPSSSRSLPPGTRLVQDELAPAADHDLLHNMEHFLPSQTQAMMPYTSTYASSTQQSMVPVGFAQERASDFHSHVFTVPPYQSHHSRQHSNWQEAEISPTAVSRRPLGNQEQHFLLDPRFTAHVMAMKAPFNVHGNYGAVAPLSFNTLQSLAPYYPVGIGSVPAALPAPEVEQGLQSAKLFDFKMAGKNTRRYELRDIYEHIAEFAGDQHGSRFIQTKLETANSDEKERVFREIEPNAIPLMTDVFGNYVIQKFFDHGHQEHKRILANKMRGQVLNLSTQMYGCRVVQKALEHVLLEQQAALVNELKHHVLKCVKDQNGNHVIQKVIERCSTDSISFVYEAFIGQVYNLSLHPYGCRVIQRCLERTENFAAKPSILAELHEGVPKGMIGDSYGNYVVQHIVQNGPEEDRKFVLDIVLADIESFSKHKFASNVVEKCIEYSNDAWRKRVVEIFTTADHRRPDCESILVGLIKDQYGNYVIREFCLTCWKNILTQRAERLLDRLPLQDYIMFHHQLQPAMTHAKRTGSGKQVISVGPIDLLTWAPC